MKFFLLLFFVFPLIVMAQFDILTGANSRSYPGMGGAAYIKAGYNIPLLGTIQSQSPWYSMLRLQTELNSSSVVYHHDTQLLWYPLGFLAIGAGRKEMTSEYDQFVFYDCEKIRCKGTLNKDYVIAKAALAFSGFIFSHEYRISRISYSDKDETLLQPGEYEFTLSTHPEFEMSHRRVHFIGYKMGDDVVGAYGTYIDFHESDKFFSEHYLIYSKKINSWEIILGGGNLYSSDQKPSPTAIIQINYKFISNLAMF